MNLPRYVLGLTKGVLGASLLGLGLLICSILLWGVKSTGPSLLLLGVIPAWALVVSATLRLTWFRPDSWLRQKALSERRQLIAAHAAASLFLIGSVFEQAVGSNDLLAIIGSIFHGGLATFWILRTKEAPTNEENPTIRTIPHAEILLRRGSLFTVGAGIAAGFGFAISHVSSGSTAFALACVGLVGVVLWRTRQPIIANAQGLGENFDRISIVGLTLGAGLGLTAASLLSMQDSNFDRCKFLMDYAENSRRSGHPLNQEAFIKEWQERVGRTTDITVGNLDAPVVADVYIAPCPQAVTWVRDFLVPAKADVDAGKLRLTFRPLWASTPKADQDLQAVQVARLLQDPANWSSWITSWATQEAKPATPAEREWMASHSSDISRLMDTAADLHLRGGIISPFAIVARDLNGPYTTMGNPSSRPIGKEK